ncbi:MAG: prolyl oligopeptidase family serine peptidase [Acidobacteriota bacterium]
MILRRPFFRPSLLLLPLTLIACTPPEETSLTYPQATRSDHVDTYFGVDVPDPYRWLEDLASPATQEFVASQNALAQPHLEAIARREGIRQRMTELWSYERFGTPKKRGGRYFYETNDGQQEQDVLVVADALDAEPRVVIDPNPMSDDATISLANWEPSPDGSQVAWGISDGGTDWRIWRIRDVASGDDAAETLTAIKFSEMAWATDSSGFYYSRYPRKADGTPDGSQPVAVYYHQVGTPQSEDRHVYSTDAASGHDPYPRMSDGGRYLLLNLFEGYAANAVHVLDLANPEAPAIRLLDAWDGRYVFLGDRGNELFFHTTQSAPNARVIAIDLDQGATASQPETWREVIAESTNTLDGASLVGDRVVTRYLVDARSQVLLYDVAGGEAVEVELPGIGTATGFTGGPDDNETFFELESFTAPPAIYRLDVATAESTVFRQPKTNSEDADFETHQVFFTSKDGTRVPMFLIHRPGIERSDDNPTLLYGYGGFNVAETPEYRVRWTMWLEMGGLLAIANLRGGGEYGTEWHQAGTKTQKQNVFDDFIAAAEWLIAEQYTQSSKLAIHGRSNGGLLAAAVTLQRPDLFGVSLPAVGVLDMLRYHTASANAYQWGSDYGWSENEDQFQALAAYSPVHNVRPDTCYPATLITTADRDDRVVPWHSYKFAAALQHQQSCDRPVLLRVETRAGHGANKPTWMQVEDYADQWAFAAEVLGMK